MMAVHGLYVVIFTRTWQTFFLSKRLLHYQVGKKSSEPKRMSQSSRSDIQSKVKAIVIFLRPCQLLHDRPGLPGTQQ